MKIYLASKSPRRRELLSMMQVEYELLLFDTPEIVAPNEPPEQYSRRVTQEKLTAGWEQLQREKLPFYPVVCADTEVVLDNCILGKPQNPQEAFQMIKNLAGRSHDVITSIGLKYFDYQKIVTNSTRVTFSDIPDEAIHHYLATDNYLDKSGSYGIQSYIGQFISRINGCFYSVMGLPLNSLRELLTEVQQQVHIK
ncbi:MAG: septum formation protein Maf [Legionella sp.]|nr:septum formation protein Maf [Legionella sp.]